MTYAKSRSRFGAVAAILLGSAVAFPAIAADMTFDRALNVKNEPQNWLLHHQNYAGHRYSALNQINTSNAWGLKNAFMVGLGGMESGGRYANGNLQATPIVEDGMIYTTDGWGSVYKIDVTAGTRGVVRWKYDPGTDRAWAGDVACCGVNNRGVALWKNQVISPVLDGRILAINKDTGELIWERKVADPAIAETITAAPLVIRDIAISGMAGGEFGVRGWIDATDLNTGKQAWRTHTIPGKGEPGNETWMDDHDSWLHGGATTWETGTYDPEVNLTYWGTGNAGPDYDPEYRPGDNKWAASVLAFDATSGAIKWGFQYTPNDPYDYDEIGEHPLIDMTINGQTRKMVVHAARNGFYYALDRANGAFSHAKQYVDKVTWTKGLDPKTGMPLEYDPKLRIQVYQPGTHGTRAEPKAVTCGAIIGGKNWMPSAYNPTTGLLYVSTGEGCSNINTVEQKHFNSAGGPKPRDRFTGGGLTTPMPVAGTLKAIDVVTGETKARADLPILTMSGTLATAGGLVFIGGPDGTFAAHDARTLRQVWSYNVGTGISAPPISYSYNGKQFIAIMVGYNSIVSRVNNNSPILKYVAPQSFMAVFTL